MKVVISSLNLQAFEDWDTRVAVLTSYFGKLAPDVLCLQEVVYLPEISPFNPAHILNQSLGFAHEISDITRLQKGVVYPVYREGLSTLTNLTIMASETVVLEQEEDDECMRIIQLIDLKTETGLIIKLANIHFSITDFVDYATPHLKQTLALLKSRGEKRIIIGDFNLTYLEDSKDEWEADYISTCDTPYITYPLMDKRVDYALVPKEYSINDINISPDGLSDHRAITVTISIPETT